MQGKAKSYDAKQQQARNDEKNWQNQNELYEITKYGCIK